MVDKVDDDAWGLSAELPVGVAASSTEGSDSESSSASKLGLVIGLAAGGEPDEDKEMHAFDLWLSSQSVEIFGRLDARSAFVTPGSSWFSCFRL